MRRHDSLKIEDKDSATATAKFRLPRFDHVDVANETHPHLKAGCDITSKQPEAVRWQPAEDRDIIRPVLLALAGEVVWEEVGDLSQRRRHKNGGVSPGPVLLGCGRSGRATIALLGRRSLTSI